MEEMFFDEVPEGFTVVEWPHSQDYMEEPWFEEEAILINGGNLYEIHGDSAYLIPNEYLKNHGVQS